MASALNSTKVLIVDDSALMRGMLRDVLSREGYLVVGELASGMNLLDTISQLKPNIICLDYNLPHINGIDLLCEVTTQYPSVAVIMVTGSEEFALEHMAVQAGASGFVRKPLCGEAILKVVAQVAEAQTHLAKALALPTHNASSGKRATAIVADDSVIMRRLIVAILGQMEVQVLGQARNGVDALVLVEEHHPDLVCLDIDMPGMNGMKALQHIKRLAPRTQVLMISGRSDRDSIVQAVKGGANGYILKPFQPDKVIAAVQKCTEALAVPV